nr:alpha/beta fold hydrolase [Lysobacter sp. GX 14042]
MVWSPCASAPVSARSGPYDLQGNPGCPVEGDALPLVVISHGQGGTLMGHHDTATALADAGFVVVTFNHPGDSFGDDSAAQQVGIFESRPRDASRVVSFMLEGWRSRRQLDPEAIGVFGFSRGGYTALALAGATPSVAAAGERLCARWWSLVMPLCRGIRIGEPTLEPVADPRIRAAVVVDPLNLFDAAGLRTVRVPVQLWASEQGGDGVEFEHIEAIRTALPAAPEYHLARGAGHFAYLAPCTPRLAETAPGICEDPDGFDRLAWHRTLNAAVVAFFRRHLQVD